jgi:predicted transcriptional regulator
MWKEETAFVSDFLTLCQEKNRSVHIMKEFRTGYGFPDILMLEYTDNAYKRVKQLIHNNVEPISTSAAYIITYLSKRRWVNIYNIKNHFQMRNGSFNAAMDLLKQRGLIEINGDKVKGRPKKETFILTNITVLEAKLKNWGRAISQAQRYLWFTDNSSILIPKRTPPLLEKIAYRCKKSHVGLIALDTDRKAEPVVKTKRRKPYNTYLAWMLNEMLVDELRVRDKRI